MHQARARCRRRARPGRRCRGRAGAAGSAPTRRGSPRRAGARRPGRGARRPRAGRRRRPRAARARPPGARRSARPRGRTRPPARARRSGRAGPPGPRTRAGPPARRRSARPRRRRGSPSRRRGGARGRSGRAVGTRANSRTGWSHPERATCRSVSSAARVSGSVTGWGASVTGPWCPMAAQVAGVHCSPRSTRGFTRRRDEESSESLGVVRRARGSGRRFGTPGRARRGVRWATAGHRSAASRAAGHDAARPARASSSSAASSPTCSPTCGGTTRSASVEVFVKELTTKVGLFVAAGAHHRRRPWPRAWSLAYRTRPLYIPVTPAQQVLEQYRQAIEPLRRIAVWAVPVVLGLLAGSGSMGAWRTFLLWANREPFGIKDPQFGLDVGFFVFTLPWLRFVVSFLTVVLVLAFVAAAFTHYVYGGLQLPGRGPTTRAAYVHLGILGALIALTRAASYWLDRYSLSTQKGSLLTGITYTDDNAVLPTKAILAVAAADVRRLLPRRDLEPQLAAADHRRRAARRHRRRRGRHLPGADPVAEGQPLAEVARGASTSSATSTPPERRSASTGSSASRTRRRPRPRTRPSCAPPPTTSPGVRIIDPNVVAPTFRQLQAQRDYYAFPDTLDVDRYTIDEQTRDAVVAVREINLEGLPDNQRNWLNDHTVYTHGYGFYAAYGNQRTTEGDPVFFEGGGRSAHRRVRAARCTSVSCPRPTPSSVPTRAPRRASSTTPPVARATSPCRTPTPATAACRSARPLRRLAYAIKYREANFLLSDAVNGDSRILDHRTPTERVERVAPVAAARRQRLPRRRRGPRAVDRRRVHDLGELPQQPADRARGGHLRLGRPALQRRHRRRRPGQLRAQRRQGHRRRLRPATSSSTAGTPRTRCSRRGATRSRARCGRSRRSPAT